MIATAVGFSLYFYILKHMSPTRVALVTLMSPVLALWLGQVLNNEPITREVLAGTALIMSALLLFENATVFERLRRRFA